MRLLGEAIGNDEDDVRGGNTIKSERYRYSFSGQLVLLVQNIERPNPQS